MRSSLSLLLAVSWLAASRVLAQADAAALETPEALLARAEAALEAQELETALALFAQADALRPSARTRVGIGFAAFGTGDEARAYGALTAALAERRPGLSAETRARAAALLEEITASLGRIRPNRQPRGAELRVDGEPRVLVEGMLLVHPGEHRIEVRAPRYARGFETVEVQRGEEVRVRIRLMPLSTPAGRAAEQLHALFDSSVSHTGGDLFDEGDGQSGIGVAVARPARVRLAADPEVTGPMRTQVVRRVLRDHVGTWRRCADATTGTHRDGTVSLGFDVDARGAVIGARVLDTTLAGADVGTCMVRAVERVPFPSQGGRASVRVRIRLTIDFDP